MMTDGPDTAMRWSIMQGHPDAITEVMAATPTKMRHRKTSSHRAIADAIARLLKDRQPTGENVRACVLFLKGRLKQYERSDDYKKGVPLRLPTWLDECEYDNTDEDWSGDKAEQARRSREQRAMQWWATLDDETQEGYRPRMACGLTEGFGMNVGTIDALNRSLLFPDKLGDSLRRRLVKLYAERGGGTDNE